MGNDTCEPEEGAEEEGRRAVVKRGVEGPTKKVRGARSHPLPIPQLVQTLCERPRQELTSLQKERGGKR